MSRLFTELTIKEMKRVIDSLPDPVNYYRRYDERVYSVLEPRPYHSLLYGCGDQLPPQVELNVYHFRVTDYEWVMV